jgi:hypothetical protein
MKKLQAIILFLSTLFFSSCFGLFDSGSDTIIGDYKTIWIDLHANQSISKEIELNSGSYYQVIGEYVFSVGHNDDYIIAKQHPTNGFENGFQVNTKITNYFIIELKSSKLNHEERVFGPLDKNNFNELRKKLKIENIEFDLNYTENPR